MVKMLFEAHSGLRYLVLLAALAALVYLAYARFRGEPWNRTANALSAAFTGLLDLQVVLGLALLLNFQFYSALTGHIVSMVLALVAAHVLRVKSKRAAEDGRKYGFAIAAVVVPLVLVIGGILAIGRSIV